MVRVSAWNDARQTGEQDWRSGCELWSECTIAPVAAAARLPGQPVAATDGKIVFRSAAVQTHTVFLEAAYRIPCELSRIDWPGRVTCTRCAGRKQVCPVFVSGEGSTGRSSSSNSSNSSGDNSFFSRRKRRRRRRRRSGEV